MYSDRGAPVMCKMPSAGKSFADIAGRTQQNTVKYSIVYLS